MAFLRVPADGSSAASGLAGVLIATLRDHLLVQHTLTKLSDLSEAAGKQYFSPLARHQSSFSVSTLRAAISSWKRLSPRAASSLISGAALPVPAVSFHAVHETVHLG